MDMENVLAFHRVNWNECHITSKLSVRAGDEDVFIARKGATIGRSVHPDANSKAVMPRSVLHKKLNLGIWGSESGVSRKHLQIQSIKPTLKLMQYPNVTNQVYVIRYNPLMKKMENKGCYINKGMEFELKRFDVIVMDHGRDSPLHAFRIVECLVPRQNRDVATKKRSFGETSFSNEISSPIIDLVDDSPQSQPDTMVRSLKSSLDEVANENPIAPKTLRIKQKQKTDAGNSESLEATMENIESLQRENNEKAMKSPERQVNEISANEMSLDNDQITKSQSSKEKRDPKDLKQHSLLTLDTSSNQSLPSNDPALRKNPISEAIDSGTNNTSCANITIDSNISSTIPKVGDVIRIKMDTKDFFSRKVSAWWFATIAKVEEVNIDGNHGNMHYNLKVTFLDKSASNATFPDEGIHFLEVIQGSRHVHALVPSASGFERELALDLNPDSLSVGDLVDAYYQNGGLGGNWFRARVAAVNNENETCTLIYEDGDVEFEVPMRKGKIILVERGESNPTWVIGINVEYRILPKTRTTINSSSSKMVMATNVLEIDGIKFVEVSFSSRDKSRNVDSPRFPYTHFISCVFNSYLDKSQAKTKWPSMRSRSKIRRHTSENLFRMKNQETTLREPDLKNLEAPSKQPDLKNLNSPPTEPGLKNLKAPPTNPCLNILKAPPTEPRLKNLEIPSRQPDLKKMKEPHTEPDLKKLKAPPAEPDLKNQKVPPTKPDLKNQKAPPSKPDLKNLKAPPTEPDLTCQEATSIQTMPQIIANSLFRALNSSDPDVGSNLLIQIASRYHQGMNLSLGRQIRDMLLEGPVSEGMQYPDPYRLEVTMKYLEELNACPGGELNIQSACSPFDWSTLLRMMQCTVTPRYITSNQPHEMTRLLESFHLCNHGAKLIRMLFVLEFGEKETLNLDVTERHPLPRKGPIASAILNNPDGARNSLKAIIKLYVDSWLRFGHLVVNGDSFYLQATKNMHLLNEISMCRRLIKGMLKNLADVLSYSLRLYNACEGISASTQDMISLFKEIYDLETNRKGVNQTAIFPDHEDTESQIMKRNLYMIVFLQDEISCGFRPLLAKHFAIESEFNSIMHVMDSNM